MQSTATVSVLLGNSDKDYIPVQLTCKSVNKTQFYSFNWGHLTRTVKIYFILEQRHVLLARKLYL